MSKTIKNILIFIIILVIIGVAYFMFFGKTKNVPAATSNSALQTSAGTAPTNSVINPNPLTGAEATRISQEFVNQLINLQAIKLKDDIFSSLAFQSLQDFSIVLVQPGNEGRPNPFAPFGADEADPNAPATPGGDIFTPGAAWISVKLANKDVFYSPSWMTTPINYLMQGATQSSIVGHTFTLPDGAQIVYGGPQAACNSGMFGSFQYGVSVKTCVKNVTAELIGQNPSAESKNAFGDFVQKNM